MFLITEPAADMAKEMPYEACNALFVGAGIDGRKYYMVRRHRIHI
jgi:hypothetical protein